MLQPLGISPSAEAAYIALASTATATTAELAKRASLSQDAVPAAMAELSELGLIVEMPGNSWQALPLPEVAKALRIQRISELELAMAAAESLQSRLAAAAAAESEDIRVLVGRDAILPVHLDLFNNARSEICIFDKPPYVETFEVSEEAFVAESPEWQALERGIRMRSVYNPGFDAERLKELRLFAGKGEVSRTATVPMKLIIVDHQVAMIPSMRSYLPGHELMMSVVHHPTLVEALVWLFEGVWDTAIPIAAAATSDTDPRRQMLISLLMTGSTDNAIASNLGVNVRSIRRWISELMDELGVTTRLQLGAALVRVEVVRAETRSTKPIVR